MYEPSYLVDSIVTSYRPINFPTIYHTIHTHDVVPIVLIYCFDGREREREGEGERGGGREGGRKRETEEGESEGGREGGRVGEEGGRQRGII